ncbi:MAG: DUF6894 family protein [Brevundimonas sp.]
MRYFFHSANGEVFTDEEGEELADDAEARREAVLLFAALMRDRPDAFWAEGRFSVRVIDAGGRSVAEIVATLRASPAVLQA